MSPTLHTRPAATRSFPRVSGDEPSEPLSWAPLIQFSPRERG